MAAPAQTIEALLKENRTFSPPPAFVERANCSDPGVYERAARDPEAWWASWAERLSWSRRWDKVLEWRAPVAKWFAGGKINASAQCLDRHVRAGLGGRVALYWEGEPGDARVLTYADMLAGASRLGNALRELGVGRGDRVAVYMPMVPELAMTLLACARIGAVFSVVFGGFSANALKERINDQKARLVICADGCWRRGKVLDLKAVVDEAVAGCPTVEKVLVWRRGKGVATAAKGGPRDVEWSAVVDRQYDTCRAEEMDAEDPLFILYTSGTTGKPKGIFHTTGGYLVGVYATTNYVFDLKPDRDIYWCTADIGWVTGHSYIVFGPMAHAATQVMYEGAPDWPRPDRFWELIEKYRVTVFYTAPTAIRAFMKWGDEHPAAHNLASLRLLGSVGEPINPEAWIWYHARIGGGRCPIVDTWWQTETGMILITPLPGLTETVPGSATRAFPGVDAAIVDNDGREVEKGGGYLVLRRPWPAMTRGIWGDPARYAEQYWSRFPGVYFTGDGGRIDERGYFWVLGRVDDVMNVSGHRLSTMEIESALVDHPAVAEAAVVGVHDDLRGEAPVAFVTLRQGNTPSPALENQLKAHVGKVIGGLAKPRDLFFTPELPKTRSGKIMRRLLRDMAEGRRLGDTTTLADPNVLSALRSEYESKET